MHDLRAGQDHLRAGQDRDDLRVAARLREIGVVPLLSVGLAPIAQIGPPFGGVQVRGDPDGARIAAVRAALPDGALVGASVHAPARPLPPGLDYAVVAPVFAPRSSRGKVPIGLEGLAAFARAQDATGVPLVALGGLTPDRVRPLLSAGAQAVAGITCFLGPARTVVQDAPAVLAAVARAREGATGAAP